MGIENEILYRDDSFAGATDELFESITEVLEGIAEHLEIDMVAIEWTAMKFDGGVVIMEMLADEYSVDDDGEIHFDISDEGEVYQRKITVGIPAQIVDLNDKERVKLFLRDVEKQREKEQQVEAVPNHISEEFDEASQHVYDLFKKKAKRTVH